MRVCVCACVFVLNNYMCPKSLETTSQAQAFPMPPNGKIPICPYFSNVSMPISTEQEQNIPKWSLPLPGAWWVWQLAHVSAENLHPYPAHAITHTWENWITAKTTCLQLWFPVDYWKYYEILEFDRCMSSCVFYFNSWQVCRSWDQAWELSAPAPLELCRIEMLRTMATEKSKACQLALLCYMLNVIVGAIPESCLWFDSCSAKKNFP